MSPGRVIQIGSSMGPTYKPVSSLPSAQIPPQEEMLSPNRIETSMDLTDTLHFIKHLLNLPNKKKVIYLVPLLLKDNPMQKNPLVLKKQKVQTNQLIQLLWVPNMKNGEKHQLQKR